MRHAPSTSRSSHPFRPLAPAGAIEWEELPSLADSLAKRLVVLGAIAKLAANSSASPAAAPPRAAGVPWDSTRPAELEVAVASQPFREPLEGVAIREVNEPDIFRHFFGA